MNKKIIAVAVAAFGLWLLRKQSLINQAAAFNAECVKRRSIAQQAASADPTQKAQIRAQVEQMQGQPFISDFEWESWIKSQSIAECSATPGKAFYIA